MRINFAMRLRQVNDAEFQSTPVLS